MPGYICHLCNKELSTRQRLITHYNKKIPCCNIKLNIDATKYINEALLDNVKNKTLDLTHIDSNCDNIKINKKKKRYICEYCNLEVSKNSNLHRHYRRCKVKKDLDKSEINKDKVIKRLKTQISKLKSENTALKDENDELKKKIYSEDKVIIMNFNKESINDLDNIHNLTKKS